MNMMNKMLLFVYHIHLAYIVSKQTLKQLQYIKNNLPDCLTLWSFLRQIINPYTSFGFRSFGSLFQEGFGGSREYHSYAGKKPLHLFLKNSVARPTFKILMILKTV